MAPLLLPLPIVLAALLLSERPLECGPLPSLTDNPESATPPDFVALPAGPVRKQGFVDYLLPIVEAENRRVHKQRITVQCLAADANKLQPSQRQWLQQLAKRYRVDTAVGDDEFWQQLLVKVDSIPPSLALAQGANESAWGTSRFARQGNNLFGLWCFQPGCGLVPLGRPQGASYEVKKFASLDESVREYLRTLNSHPSYRQLRELRAGQAGASGEVLAAGLTEYSARGQAYVDELRHMIRFNNWQRYDTSDIPGI